VVFLRAINTGRRRVRMADLRSAIIDAGFADAETYLASGNVILTARERPAREALEAIVLDRFGFESEAFIRSGSEIRGIVAACPWTRDGDLVEVSFLERRPDPDAARALEATVQPPEGLAVTGTEVFFLREGKGIETTHKESMTERLLGMRTTRRGMATVRVIGERIAQA
jgi:uncharacterized protein (DUF1697 family)